GIEPAAGNRRGDRLAERAGRLVGVELEEARAVVELALGLTQRLAVLERDQPGEAVAMAADQLVPAAPARPALLARPGGPGRKGGSRGGDGPPGLVLAEIGDLGDRLQRVRILDRDRRCRPGNPLAVDQIARDEQVCFVERAALGVRHLSSSSLGLVIGTPPSNRCSNWR